MIVSIDAEKAFDKIQHLFLAKSLSHVEIEGNFLKDTLTNIILNSEKWNAFSSRPRTKQQCLLSLLLLNIILKVLASAVRQEKASESSRLGRLK